MKRKTYNLRVKVDTAGKMLRANNKGTIYLTEEGKKHLANITNIEKRK